RPSFLYVLPLGVGDLYAFPTRRSSDLNSSALGSISGSTVILVGATLELQNNIAIPAGERLSLGSSAVASGTLRNVSGANSWAGRSEEHTSELQSLRQLVCRLPLAKRNG